jgi:hypothetical protein
VPDDPALQTEEFMNSGTRKCTIAALALGLAMTTLTGCASVAAKPIDYSAGELSGTDQDFAVAMAACLQESGWEVETRPDNSFGITLQASQESAFEAAETDCSERLGYDEHPEALSDAQLRRLYGGLTSLVRCLGEEGYVTRDLPSEQAFLDGSVFDPYGELRDPTRPNTLSNDEYYALLAKCPRP